MFNYNSNPIFVTIQFIYYLKTIQMVHEVQVILKYLHTCIYKLSDKAKVDHCVCVEWRTDKLIISYN